VLSIIIPTLNEGSNLARLLPHALATCPQSEIIVVDGGSCDDTREAAIRFPRVRFLTSVPGRARQMTVGALAARGDVLLFLHADTFLPPGTQAAIREALADPGVVCGRFDVRFDNLRPVFRMIAATMNLRSRLSGIFTGDQAIFVRRVTFEALGGYPDMPLMEDVEISRRLKRQGRRACLRLKVTTSARKWERDGILRTILLMWTLRFLYFVGVNPHRLHTWYYGNGTDTAGPRGSLVALGDHASREKGNHDVPTCGHPPGNGNPSALPIRLSGPHDLSRQLPRVGHREGQTGIPGRDKDVAMTALAIMAKQPLPGKVKTRLSPPLTLEEAARLSHCFLLDTVERIQRLPGVARYLAFAPPDARDFFRGLAGEGFVLLPQVGADLGERLAHLSEDLFAARCSAAVIIGADSPTLPEAILCEALDVLTQGRIDIVLGPADDGGYYLIGQRSPNPSLFQGIAWSTDAVLSQTLERAVVAGLRTHLLPAWSDVDTPGDLGRLGQELADDRIPAPHTQGYLRGLSKLTLREPGAV
jgi:rSAM/selenodomain-associated transferase 2/rSAM/selenodomain-associated transferase 1